MNSRLSLIMAIASSLVLAVCTDNDSANNKLLPVQLKAFIFHTDFSEKSSWQASFADYSKGKQAEWMYLGLDSRAERPSTLYLD